MVPVITSTPQKLSITSSVIITSFTAVLIVVAHWLGWELWLPIFIPIIFLISYFTTLYMLSVLINDKITPIYKTIREVPIEVKRLTKLIHGQRDIIAEVDQEVKL
jgi:two-component system phosphate regulon sensor histidine kinase PhoR